MVCFSNVVVIGDKHAHKEDSLRFLMPIGFVMVRCWFVVQIVEHRCNYLFRRRFKCRGAQGNDVMKVYSIDEVCLNRLIFDEDASCCC